MPWVPDEVMLALMTAAWCRTLQLVPSAQDALAAWTVLYLSRAAVAIVFFVLMHAGGFFYVQRAWPPDTAPFIPSPRHGP